MGICCGKSSKEFYTDVEMDTEKDIRIWEESVGGFKHTFGSLLNRVRFDSLQVSKSYVESFFKNHFSEDILQIANRSFFVERDLYDTKKLQALIFLLSRPDSRYANKIFYMDKSIYTLQEILVDEEDDLKQPIEPGDNRLREYLELLINTTYEITEFYLEKTGLKEDDYFKEILPLKSKLTDYIIKSLLRKGDRAFSFNNEDLSNNFYNNKWFLSSGYFRESAYELAKLGHLYDEKK